METLCTLSRLESTITYKAKSGSNFMGCTEEYFHKIILDIFRAILKVIRGQNTIRRPLTQSRLFVLILQTNGRIREFVNHIKSFPKRGMLEATVAAFSAKEEGREYVEATGY